MSRLIVLSNRVKMPDNNPMAGGLAVALHDMLIGNSGIWMGWNGDIVDACDDGVDNEFNCNGQATATDADVQVANKNITYMTTALTSKQYQHFYCGFANNVLWLLLHEQAHLISQAPEDYAGYQAVNQLFAKQLKKIIQPDDVIWVHDYHFLSVAYYCRQLGLNNRIGLFLHIPFAPLTFWQKLDQSPELIKHLAHYDVFGTQTEQDKANCLAVFNHYLKDSYLNTHHLIDSMSKTDSMLKTDNMLKKPSNNLAHTAQNFAKSNRSAGAQLVLNLDLDAPHHIMIDAYPIGIDVAKIQQQVINSSSYLSSQYKRQMPEKTDIKSAVQQIIAVDRIDYSKGLLERFSAYRQFLQQYPAYQNQLKLIQIACPSRLDLPVYQRLYNNVRQTVNKLNQQFSPIGTQSDAFKIDDVKACNLATFDSTNNWQAITYSESVLSHGELMAAFWYSDIGWVNSLKDGMNLVAKEYIAAQNPDNPGVLLLSDYAGAAEQMQAAVIIDPHNPKSIIQGLNTALTMPLKERKSRYQTLLQGLWQYDLQAWQQDFLEDLYR